MQERNRLPDVADDELNVPPPEPLRFDIDEPALLDDDMLEILLLEEASPVLYPPHLKVGHLRCGRPAEQSTTSTLSLWG